MTERHDGAVRTGRARQSTLGALAPPRGEHHGQLPMTSLHDFEAADIDGEPVVLSAYAGKACLIVNVASACGFTPQYAALEKLYRERKDEGLVVLGFPCDQFGHQEPGDDAEIKAFCASRFDVTFPLFSKLEVNGRNRHPLYAWLASQDADPEGRGDVRWNFGKFVVGRSGALVSRFPPATEPDAETLGAAIDRALGT